MGTEGPEERSSQGEDCTQAQAVFCHKQHPQAAQGGCWNGLTPGHVQHCASTLRDLLSAQAGAARESGYWGEAWQNKEQGTDEVKE